MSVTTQHRQVDLVDRLAAEARKRVAPELADSAEQFIRRYFAHVAPDDVIYTSFDTLLGGALSLWELGSSRKPGTALVRVFNPSEGWTTEHTVLEIVNDDMPFLVDSVTAEIARRDRKMHLLLHPVVRVRRDASGRRLEVTNTATTASDAIVESYMHLEFDQETEPAELDAIRASIENILGQVRLAVSDWKAMRARLAADVAELETTSLPMPGEEVEEAKSFLRWLDDGHFVFLGHRSYTFATKGGRDYAEPQADSGLGIMRELSPESIARGKEPLSQVVSDHTRRKDLIIVRKTGNRSLVHRNVPMDLVAVKRYDEKGNVAGVDRFLGLFTSAAYSGSVREIPMLRLKAARVLESAGFDPSSHNGKALADILETYPRDEFFQVTDSELSEISRGILLLQERQRVALFMRHDVFDRFVSCYVYVPRERYTSEFKERAKAILEAALNGCGTVIEDHITSSPLARGLFVVRAKDSVPAVDVRELELQLTEASLTWSDRLLDTLIDSKGEEAGIDLHRRYMKAFPAAYQDRFDAAAAVHDVASIESVQSAGELVANLYRQRGEESQFHLKVIHSGDAVPLSEIMPRLENMGLEVQTEVPYEITPLGAAGPVRVRDFTLSADRIDSDLDAIRDRFRDAFVRVWHNEVENDGFNKLVICAGLDWRQVVILRAYAKYFRQVGVSFSEAYMQQTLAKHSAISAMLVQLFETWFDPQRGGSIEERGRAAEAIRTKVTEALEKITNPDDDRILRLYVDTIEATLRTNFYQTDAEGKRKAYVSFKLDSAKVPELPLPRPMFEIWVYAPWVEGIHLRGGRVARGGLRWSDRREDFRTEILGLVKAQMVKNVVIVPMGSKGGFVVKNPSADRATFQQEGIHCYKTLLRGLLDVTDNIKGTETIPPREVVRRDGNDPYLVVAADKGTATFSDIANSVSAEYGFWLGDAFASGGSVGYDHKEMGITARGGWEAVKRHFREIGKNIQEVDFTAVGVGDMAGDVFGNAMLLSEQTKLVAVFNYSHIFIDPDPDPAVSFKERRRMFDERLNWNHYNLALLSKGGGIYERSAKTITISDEAQKLLELPSKTVTPIEAMRAILKANVELLWLGGIGTYVKSSDEDQAAARDRSNDALRINGNELRVKVVGEGANLGFTQLGRVEYALNGGRLNTDAIDNSAGVDTSDHEVNIKIGLYDAIAHGELKSLEERNEFLASMTDDVGQLVLRDNYEQTQAITVTEALGESLLDAQTRFMRGLEKAGRLNRRIEGLPDDETIAERHAKRIGLTRPEIAVLLAYAKLVLFEDLLKTDLPDDPQLVNDLVGYFPEAMRTRFRPAIDRHRLRREIIATVATNAIINRVRPTFVWQMTDETGKPAGDVTRAFLIMRDAFGLQSIWADIESLDNKVPAAAQSEMMIAVGRLLERATTWLLRSGYQKLDVAANVAELGPRIGAIQEKLASILPSGELAAVEGRQNALMERGVPEPLARRVASLDVMASAMDIINVARKAEGRGVDDVAKVYFGIGARFGLDHLRTAGSQVATETPWQKAAVTNAIDDLFSYQSILTSRVIGETNGVEGDPVESWLASRARVAEHVGQTLSEVRNAPALDLAMLTVATRELRTLVES
ncbi:MAG: NAD-glutamate dehydrogenase [Thermoanaerobaculia bacterium]